MFSNLFQPKPSVKSVEVAVLEEPKRKYSKEIEQVHHEFEVAAEILYKEAVEILTNNKINNPDKINRLKSLGFCAVKEVVEVREKEEKVKVSQETIDLIQQYKVKYPLNKFITEEQVNTICSKYGLAWGDIGRFKGFVPDKNLMEIEKFATKHKFKSVMMSRRSNMSDPMIASPERIQIVEPGKADPITSHVANEYGFLTLTFEDKSTLELQQGIKDWDGIHFYGTPRNNPAIASKMDFIYASLTSLQIAAPEKDFDMKGMTVKNHQIVKEVPDPVVLQPVKGGFLIVTAWGDEASDPLVVNELNN